MRPLIVATSALALYACHAVKPRDAPPSTRVAYQASIAPGTPRYEERDDEVSNQPVPAENPAPLYPQSAIALRLPRVSVSAKVIVDEEGRVEAVRVATAGDSAGHPPEFDDVVRTAAMQWHFTPLTFTRWHDVKDAEGNVIDSRPVSSERRPFSLDFDFFFELRDGKPVVGSQPQQGARRD